MYGHFFANCLILLNGVSTVVVVELQHQFNVRCNVAMRLLDAIKRLPPSIPKKNVQAFARRTASRMAIVFSGNTCKRR